MAEPIQFSLEPEEGQKSALDEEREKHKTRAERFGTEYKDPASLPKFVQEARRERFKREGFATGIDVFSEEEAAKRAARALKFGLPQERVAGPAYAPDPEDAKRRARAAKFGVAYEPPSADTLLRKADLFEPRKDAPEDVPRREEAVYLYGVDVMSSRDCLAYFDDYGPTLVEWINDSSCCVVFADAASARRAIAGSGHPLAAEDLASAPDSLDQHMSEAGLDPAANIPFLWHKGRDFIKTDAKGQDTKVPLLYRMATVLDEKDPHADKRSRYLWKAQGKRRYGDYSQEQQHQQPRQHHRGQQQHGGAEDEGGWEAADGTDADMKRARGPRGGRKQRRQQQQRQQQGGELDSDDADMQDVEYVPEDEALAAAAAAAAAAGQEGGGEGADPHKVRQQLKLADAARRAEDEELPYEEVLQPDEDGDDGM